MGSLLVVIVVVSGFAAVGAFLMGFCCGEQRVLRALEQERAIQDYIQRQDPGLAVTTGPTTDWDAEGRDLWAGR